MGVKSQAAFCHKNGKLKARYTYDSLNRIIREDNAGLGTTETYSYDNGGNILAQTEYPYTLAQTEYLTGGDSKLYSYDNYMGDQLSSYNGESYTYDVFGNPTTYRDKICTYIRGRMLKSSGDVNFTYDATGTRKSKG